MFCISTNISVYITQTWRVENKKLGQPATVKVGRSIKNVLRIRFENGNRVRNRTDARRTSRRRSYLGDDQRRVEVRSAGQPDAPRTWLAVPFQRHGPRAGPFRTHVASRGTYCCWTTDVSRQKTKTKMKTRTGGSSGKNVSNANDGVYHANNDDDDDDKTGVASACKLAAADAPTPVQPVQSRGPWKTNACVARVRHSLT